MYCKRYCDSSLGPIFGRTCIASSKEQISIYYHVNLQFSLLNVLKVQKELHVSRQGSSLNTPGLR